MDEYILNAKSLKVGNIKIIKYILSRSSDVVSFEFRSAPMTKNREQSRIQETTAEVNRWN